MSKSNRKAGKNGFGAIVCRMGPITRGHEALVNYMIHTHGKDSCIIILGSANSTLSWRNLFSYPERRKFIAKIFPEILIVPHGDYKNDYGAPDNTKWFVALDDILRTRTSEPEEVTFYGGCEEDIIHFIDAKRKVKIVNRFDGSTPVVSATEVRDALLHDRSITEIINPLIQEELIALFKVNWERLKNLKS